MDGYYKILNSVLIYTYMQTCLLLSVRLDDGVHLKPAVRRKKSTK